MVLPLLNAVLKWNLLTDPLSLYGRRLCRTVPACCTGPTCLNVRAYQMFAAADILTLFSEKNQKPNSARKSPITSIQIRTESQKLSEFSCITFRSLNRGRPPFQPQSLKITRFWPWGVRGWRGGGSRIHKARRPLIACGGGEGEARATVLVPHTPKCMQISLSPISVLLRQPLSIKKSYAGAVQR
jgi:hypothetical protein